jgi:hypothetical protein
MLFDFCAAGHDYRQLDEVGELTGARKLAAAKCVGFIKAWAPKFNHLIRKSYWNRG